MDVFISYRRQDKEAAEAIDRCLRGCGLSVWRDDRLLAGEDFTHAIFQRLLDSRCVVLCWSKQAASSPWVRAEAQVALQRGVLVPVLLDRAPLPPEWMHLNALDLSSWPMTEFSAETDAIVLSVARVINEVEPSPPAIELIVNPTTLEPLPKLQEQARQLPDPKQVRMPFVKPANRHAHWQRTVPLTLAAANGLLLLTWGTWVVTKNNGLLQTLSPIAVPMFGFMTLAASWTAAWSLSRGAMKSLGWALLATTFALPLVFLGVAFNVSLADNLSGLPLDGTERMVLAFGIASLAPWSFASPWIARSLRRLSFRFLRKRRVVIAPYTLARTGELTEAEVEAWWTQPRRKTSSARHSIR